MSPPLHSHHNSANFPTDDEGRVYHVGVKLGEVANKIITVGDPARAIVLATYLDGAGDIDPTRYRDFLNYRSHAVFIHTSKRMFTTVTGRYKGVPVSIIAIGMGIPMTDFFVREVRAVVRGPLHIIRFGSCGALGDAKSGDLVVADESMCCTRNYSYFVDHEDRDLSPEDFAQVMAANNGPYQLSAGCKADEELTSALVDSLSAVVPPECDVRVGLDVTCDSFYSSQARDDPSFVDANAHLFTYLRKRLTGRAECLQMETYMLYHLAHCARPLQLTAGDDHAANGNGNGHAATTTTTTTKSIRVAACAMVFANRVQNTWIDPALTALLEERAGRAVLDALVQVPLDESLAHPAKGAVWEI
ncbi:hypothetical protein RI367_002666 [Sorochytrium milnesiophthora]